MILFAVNIANTVSVEKTTPSNEATSKQNDFNRSNDQSAQPFERDYNFYNSANNRNSDQRFIDRVNSLTRELANQEELEILRRITCDKNSKILSILFMIRVVLKSTVTIFSHNTRLGHLKLAAIENPTA